MSSVAESLTKLWAIQKLDSELDTLRNKVTEIPTKIEGLNLHVSDEKRQLEETHRRIRELKVKYREMELDVKDAEERIGAKSAQLFSAKTNEMYKAFIKELEALRAGKNGVEEQMIEVMDELEKAETLVKRLERETLETEQETIERVKTLEREFLEYQQAVVTREDERAALVGGLDAQLLRIYERIRANKRGLAVVSVGGGRCNGCLNPLPPQLTLEVDKRGNLHFCEHCGRILAPEDIAC